MRINSVRSLFVVLAAGIGLPTMGAGQASPPAETITGSDISAHRAVIGHDSMLGRATPSLGLELTARYVADRFQRLGLVPGGDSGTWFQRYSLRPRLDFARSHLVFTAGGKTAVAPLNSAARSMLAQVPGDPKEGRVIVVSGQHAADSLKQLSGRNAIIVYVGSIDNAVDGRLETLLTGNRGLAVLSDQDSTLFAWRTGMQIRGGAVAAGPTGAWAIHALPEAITGLDEVFTAAGLDLTQLRTDATPAIREVPDLKVSFVSVMDSTTVDTATAPNVIGILQGSDPKLSAERIIVTAHMDGSAGDRREDGMSLAALLELAEAFSQPGARPRRSVLFLATSGSMRGERGAYHFVTMENSRITSWRFMQMFNVGGAGAPPVTATVTLDGIGSGSSDSIAIDGLSEVELPTPMHWLLATHPELGLSAVDGGSTFVPGSDAFWFSRIALPSLFLRHNGHEHQLASDSTRADPEQAARVARLAYYLVESMANGAKMPRWSPEGRRKFLESRTP